MTAQERIQIRDMMIDSYVKYNHRNPTAEWVEGTMKAMMPFLTMKLSGKEDK